MNQEIGTDLMVLNSPPFRNLIIILSSYCLLFVIRSSIFIFITLYLPVYLYWAYFPIDSKYFLVSLYCLFTLNFQFNILHLISLSLHFQSFLFSFLSIPSYPTSAHSTLAFNGLNVSLAICHQRHSSLPCSGC